MGRSKYVLGICFFMFVLFIAMQLAAGVRENRRLHRGNYEDCFPWITDVSLCWQYNEEILPTTRYITSKTFPRSAVIFMHVYGYAVITSEQRDSFSIYSFGEVGDDSCLHASTNTQHDIYSGDYLIKTMDQDVTLKFQAKGENIKILFMVSDFED